MMTTPTFALSQLKKALPLWVLLGCSHLALAQAPAAGSNPPVGNNVAAPVSRGNAKITGIVVDGANQQPVPFATVALNDPATGKPLDGTVCDEKGKFTINRVATGTYQLAVSFIGYQNIEKTIVVGDRELNVGTLTIASETKQLKEVTVTGQRALIEEKVDRTVYNAENDLTTRGGDATDVLKRVPMLSVDLDGNVSMRGSQNIRVLINNRPSTIAANSIADALKQIPADQIKSVEVITSPSAKYDAEGAAGIINIITKKNTLEGATLNVDGSVGLRGSNLGLNGSYRRGKMGFSLGGFGRSNYNVTGRFENRQITETPNGSQVNTQTADTRNNNLFGRYTLGWDYDINKYNFLTASVQFGVRNGNNYQDMLRTQRFFNDVLSGNSLQGVGVSDLSNTVDVNLNYTRTFEKPQREFSILTLYSRNNRSNDFIRDSLDLESFGVLNRTKNLNQSSNQEITIQTDYQTPISKNQMLELGAKYIQRQVTSDFAYYFADGPNAPFVQAQNRSLANVFNYDQNVTAGYTSYTLNFLKAYSLKAGARYEYTTIQANFQDGQQVEIPSYGVLVPSVNISKKLKNGNMLKAAYNRRIQRPSLQFLNPNRQAANPLNATEGNPDLRPEYTNNYELSYNTFFKSGSVNFTTFMRNSTGSIQPVRVPLSQDTILTTYRNIGNEDSYGLSVFTNINISNKFSLNGGTDVYYAVLNNNVTDELNFGASNQGWVISGRIFGNYNLSKGWGIQFFSFYRGRQVQLQGSQGGFGIYSLGLKKDFNNKKGSIGFGAENFFTPAFKIRNEFVSPALNQSSTNVLHNMNFKVTFSYRLGKMSMDNNARRRRKSVNNDDLKDGGGDNQGGGMQQGGGMPGGGAPSGGAPGAIPGNAPAGGQRPGGGPFQQAPGQPARQDSTGAEPGQAPGFVPGQRQRPATDSSGRPAPELNQSQQPDSLSTAPKTDSLQRQNQSLPQQTPASGQPTQPQQGEPRKND